MLTLSKMNQQQYVIGTFNGTLTIENEVINCPKYTGACKILNNPLAPSSREKNTIAISNIFHDLDVSC